MGDKEPKDHDFSLSFVAGLVVGASLLFVLGTKKGRILIEKIRDEGGGMWEDFVEEHPQLAGQLADNTEEIKEKMGTMESISKSARRFFKKSNNKAS